MQCSSFLLQDLSENDLESYGAEILSRLLVDNTTIINLNVSGMNLLQISCCFLGLFNLSCFVDIRRSTNVLTTSPIG